MADSDASRNQALDAEIDRLQGLQSELRRLSTARFVELDTLPLLYQWLDELRNLRCSGQLSGPSQTGKTIACRAYRLRNRPRSSKTGPLPAAYVNLPPKCGTRELMGLLLEAFEAVPEGHYTSHLRQQAICVARERSLRLLIADNATSQTLATLQAIDYFAEQTNAGAILVGTPELTSRLQRDKRLKRRFQPRYTFPKLEGEAFEQVVDFWEAEILKLPDPSHLSRREVIPTLADASDGRIGQLDPILRRAAIRALKKGLRAIDQLTLDEVIQDYRHKG